MFSALLMDAYRDEQPGVRIANRNDGHLLNSRRMQASTRVSTGTVHDLLFADDCVLNTVTEEDMQRSMNFFTAGYAKFGLTICTAKTVVTHQPPPSAAYNAPQIAVRDGQLPDVGVGALADGSAYPPSRAAARSGPHNEHTRIPLLKGYGAAIAVGLPVHWSATRHTQHIHWADGGVCCKRQIGSLPSHGF
ncbi:unnamed protein product [Schistocephalus solidus]|uniref:Reverse transcriptase domain-containing protein n=1 Tax=Schistocephalus solidus TaxID=70667 RepID=A0A183TBE9_SCHSO|nr:unnamed protein product [Schistocephalus solidus]